MRFGAHHVRRGVCAVRLFVVFLVGATGAAGTTKTAYAQQPAAFDSIQVGGDVSFLQRVEDAGVVFSHDGFAGDALQIFRDAGHSLMRLRLWHTPADGYNGIDTTLTLARRIVDEGLDWILDLHYSDSWADPSKQFKPAAWVGIPFDALVDSVYTYSRNTVELLRAEGLLPEYVQVGNEITSGMLWPDGRVGGSFDTPAQWDQFATLLRAGISGVRDGAGPDSIAVVVHIDRGADVRAGIWFYDNLAAQGVEFDAIGLSYYPFWHGGIDRFQYTLETLGERYGKEILVVETAFPWTLDGLDAETNLVGEVDPELTLYEPTPVGQAEFLADAASVVGCTEYGSALIYWEPEHIASAFSSPWENMALFDGAGVALPGLDSLTVARPCADRYSHVTLRLNVSTIPDTLRGDSFLAARGAVDGFAPFVLTDGRTLGWADNARLALTHKGGDYHELAVLAPRGRALQFKFWSQAAEALGLNFGWDIGEPGTNETGDSFLQVDADSTLPVRFFNADGGLKPYAWRPWQERTDSVAVLFRVYMKTDVANAQGYVGQAPFVVANSADDGPLAAPGVVLIRESDEPGSPGYDLFSSAVHLPVSQVGESLAYSFCVGLSNCESLQDVRAFTLPSADTTLHWVYYGNGRPVTSTLVAADQASHQTGIQSVWPNPAGAWVNVAVTGYPGQRVRLDLIDVLGRHIGTVGEQTLSSDAEDVAIELPRVPSGLYFLALHVLDASGSGKRIAPVVIGIRQ